MKNGEKSIVFIGFMGVGKTTIGKLAANKLGRPFIDVDEEIEKEYGLPVSQIFKQIGEKAFRAKEKQLIANFAEQENKVISLGGGAFLQEEIREICLSSCIVIHLDLSLESWKNRLSLILESRPVLHGKSIGEMEELYYSRQAIYAQHHLKINTDQRSADEIAEQIVSKLKMEFGVN